MLAVAINKKHHGSEGIRETRTFSVNIPSVDLLTETDYCGIVSGRNIDKSKVFELFFGELETAPMIAGCPICVECKLIDVYDRLPTNYLFIGEIAAVYSEEKYLTDGKPDIKKINPLILTMPENKYWVIGEHVGNARKDGLRLKE
jgi:flavin reductase (DIM6/NTAB) family NADH-FMN oxidoreductase RutF